MSPIIQVKCPHCSAQGQVVVPPAGAIVIGPCPECGEFLCVFCGTALPLDKDVLLHGDAREKRVHLMEVLTSFLEDRVAQIVDQVVEKQDQILNRMTKSGPPSQGVAQDAITTGEFKDFVDNELPLLDDANYFRTIFQ